MAQHKLIVGIILPTLLTVYGLIALARSVVYIPVIEPIGTDLFLFAEVSGQAARIAGIAMLAIAGLAFCSSSPMRTQANYWAFDIGYFISLLILVGSAIWFCIVYGRNIML